MEKIVIVGNGIAGITAARNIRKLSHADITIISGETDYFYARTALMYVYMRQMKFEHTIPYEKGFWKKNKFNLIRDWVVSIDFDNQMIIFSKNKPLKYTRLLLATGSTPHFLTCQGYQLEGVQAFYNVEDLQRIEKNTQNIQSAVIVGGGLIGVELAEMLHSRFIEVHFLVREKYFWQNALSKEESLVIQNHLKQKNIILRMDCELEEIGDENTGKVRYIITNKKEKIPCQFVGMAIGVKPNVSFLQNTQLEINAGILVDEWLQTNIKNVYAVGDCAELRKPAQNRKSIEATWYTSKIMGEHVAQNVLGKKVAFTQKLAFNSAKFFDIEYQNYGMANPEQDDSSVRTFLWQNLKKNKSIRVLYRHSDQQLLGMSTLGIRIRHRIIENWIESKKTLPYLLHHFEDISFQSEFSPTYQKEILTSFFQHEN